MISNKNVDKKGVINESPTKLPKQEYTVEDDHLSVDEDGNSLVDSIL